MAYQPLEDFIIGDVDSSSTRIRDMPFGKKRFSLTIQPKSLVFPQTGKDQTSGTQAVVLINDGYDSLTINGASTSGEFAVYGAVPTEILPGESASIQVVFAPKSVRSTFTGGLYISVPETAMGEEFIPLSGSSSSLYDTGLAKEFILATSLETSTANMILASTTVVVPTANAAVLIAVDITKNNTSSVVQISFNFGTPLNVKNGDGNNFAIGTLKAGTVVIGFKFNDTFRVFFSKEVAAFYILVETQKTAFAEIFAKADEVLQSVDEAKELLETTQETVVTASIVAEEAAESATASNTAVQLAKTIVEAARDVVVTEVGIYPDTASGLAAAPANAYFWVAPATLNAPINLYRDVAGAAVLTATYPGSGQLQAAIDSNTALSLRFPKDEYAIYVHNDGTLNVPIGGYPMTRSATKASVANHLFFEITSGVTGASCKITIRINGLVRASATVVHGTPFIQTDAIIAVTVGNTITAEIYDILGTVQGVWIQMDGANT